MTKKITVGFDGSATATTAVKWAAHEASLLDADLDVVTSYQDVLSVLSGGYDVAGVEPGRAAKRAEDEVATVVAMVHAVHPSLRVSAVVAAGAASYVLSQASDNGTLLVVGGSHNRGALGALLGNTARAVVRHSHSPVVVVNGVAAEQSPLRVLVGVDDSTQALEAVEWAAAEADLHGAPLVVVHGWHYPYSSDIGSVSAHDIMQVDAARTLERGVEHARQRCGTDVSGLLVEDTAANALLEATRDGDILVIGSHGRSAVVTTALGSTASRVLDEACVPVVVMRGTE